MKKKYFEDSVNEITKECRDLLISKHRSYGPKNITDMGELGLIVRMNDKLARLKHLSGFYDKTYISKKIYHESIEDTYRDLANYCIIALMLRQNKFDLPFKLKK